jgi:hypothetical protein
MMWHAWMFCREQQPSSVQLTNLFAWHLRHRYTSLKEMPMLTITKQNNWHTMAFDASEASTMVLYQPEAAAART